MILYTYFTDRNRVYCDFEEGKECDFKSTAHGDEQWRVVKASLYKQTARAKSPSMRNLEDGRDHSSDSG